MSCCLLTQPRRPEAAAGRGGKRKRGARERAKPVRGLPHMLDELSSVPRTAGKEPALKLSSELHMHMIARPTHTIHNNIYH